MVTMSDALLWAEEFWVALESPCDSIDRAIAPERRPDGAKEAWLVGRTRCAPTKAPDDMTGEERKVFLDGFGCVEVTVRIGSVPVDRSAPVSVLAVDRRVGPGIHQRSREFRIGDAFLATFGEIEAAVVAWIEEAGPLTPKSIAPAEAR